MDLICLVHFPDGTQTPHNLPGDIPPAAGVELMPGWIIDVIQPAKGGSYTKETPSSARQATHSSPVT
jgi:hypothetical protein